MATGPQMTCLLYITLDRRAVGTGTRPQQEKPSTNLRPEQRADDRCSQLYLLRLWREAAGAPWRLSLREASAGAAIGFADLDDLVVFLLRAMGSAGNATED